ncbi:hypothetical protein ACH4MJ_30635 [Streptomyces anulatus]
MRTIASPCGHDGFLVETEQVGPLVRELLASLPQPRPAPSAPSPTWPAT